MNKSLLALAAVAALFAHGAARADTFSVTIENPGVQLSTSQFTTSGVETFSGRGSNFSTDFGTGGAITGVYSGVQVNSADQYGGANGTGSYAVTFSSAGYSLDLSTSVSHGGPATINYFGYWLSALDGGNVVDFYKGDTKVYSFNPSDALAVVNSAGGTGYFGNPNANFSNQNGGEPYAFLNFHDTDGSFDRIVFHETPQSGGYESDNHTVGFYTAQGGTVVPMAAAVSAVPEASSWAMMALGLVGVSVVRLRRKA